LAQARPILALAAVAMLGLFASIAGLGIEHGLEVVEAERVRIYLERHAPERTRLIREIATRQAAVKRLGGGG
jgi:hypothetical protein